MFLKKLKTSVSLILLSLFIMPTTSFAYSEYVIPGGQNVGIELKSTGVMIVGLYEVNGSYPAKKAGLKEGDIILKVDGNEVQDIDTFISTVDAKKDHIVITYKRGEKVGEVSLEITKDENGTCKTGLYVKDQISGIGTLSFIDPNTKIFGALGHEILEKTTGEILKMRDGTIFASTVTGIDRSENGVPGEKDANLDTTKIYGTVFENTTRGLFGNYTDTLPETNLIKVAKPEEIHTGSAKIRTVLAGEVIKEYEIEITKVNHNMNQKTKNILFTITDQTLLKETGGIVQGMSGSPIIQDNQLVAVVTHVVVNDPTRGYGIFVTNMLEEAEN